MYLIHTIKPQYVKKNQKEQHITKITHDTKKINDIQCVILIHVLHPWYCIHLNCTCSCFNFSHQMGKQVLLKLSDVLLAAVRPTNAPSSTQ